MHFVNCDVNENNIRPLTRTMFCNCEDNFKIESRQLSWLERQSVEHKVQGFNSHSLKKYVGEGPPSGQHGLHGFYGIHQVQVTKHASKGIHSGLETSPKFLNKGINDLTKGMNNLFEKYMKKKEIFNYQDLQSGFFSTS